jgi:ubiquinone/menaquinone biosynthesis C-methylase UbiE
MSEALLDAQLCSMDNLTNVALQLKEVHRVLKPTGSYIIISHGGPETRMTYLAGKRLKWTITHEAIGMNLGQMEKYL